MGQQLGQNSGKKEQPQSGAQPQLRAGKPREWYERLMREEPKFEMKGEPRFEIKKERMRQHDLVDLKEGIRIKYPKPLAEKMIRFIRINPEEFVQQELEILANAGLRSVWEDVALEAAKIVLECAPHSNILTDAIIKLVGQNTMSWEEVITKYGDMKNFDRNRIFLIALSGYYPEPTGEILAYLKGIDKNSENRESELLMMFNEIQMIKEKEIYDDYNTYPEKMRPPPALAMPITTIGAAITFAVVFEFYFDWLVGAAAGFVGGILVAGLISNLVARIQSKVNSQKYTSKKKEEVQEAWLGGLKEVEEEGNG